MPWSLPDHDHVTYKRNPLVAVICQLRFDPVLKIAKSVPDFQDAIRGRFSLYEERQARNVEVAGGSVRVRETVEHCFRSRTEPTTVVLSDQAVSIEYRAHQHRNILLKDVADVLGALNAAQSVSPTRLGLRYVNAIEPRAVGKDLGRTLTWADLLSPGFLAIPQELATLEDTRFANEISSRLDVGQMTLRYGILDGTTGEPVFRLDIDRYREESFDVADVVDQVKGFSRDIYRVFCAAAGEALLEWMEHEDA